MALTDEQESLFRALEARDNNEVIRIVQSGVDLNVVKSSRNAADDSNEEWTPLQRACMYRRISVDIVKEMIRHGADVNFMTPLYGCTAMHYANTREKFILLLQAGGDPYRKDNSGESAIDYAEDEIPGITKDMRAQEMQCLLEQAKRELRNEIAELAEEEIRIRNGWNALYRAEEQADRLRLEAELDGKRVVAAAHREARKVINAAHLEAEEAKRAVVAAEREAKRLVEAAQLEAEEVRQAIEESRLREALAAKWRGKLECFTRNEESTSAPNSPQREVESLAAAPRGAVRSGESNDPPGGGQTAEP